MISIPTVLVLGAGASMPYGFPSGEKLKQMVIDLCDPELSSVEVNRELERFGIAREKVQEFVYSLRYSGTSSVDSLIEHRQEFLDVGKYAIAKVLVRFESHKELFKRIKGNWYEYLFNALNSDFSDFGKNKISVIAFNYDRSLEHYLITVLQNRYGRRLDECVKQISSIPIIHVYGTLGILQWQYLGGQRPRKYSPDLDHDDINIAREDIKIISENTDSSVYFENTFEMMSQAERIYFMGFGYNDVNLRRLRIDRISGDKTMLGTSYGLEKVERDFICNKWKIELSCGNADCLAFLRGCAPLK